MAELISTELFTGMLGNAAAVVKVVLVLAIISVLIWWVLQRRRYKYDIRLKVLKHGTFMTWTDTARIHKDQGVTFWRLRKLKEMVSVPPPESITQTIAGRFVAEGYYERSLGIIWSRDVMTREVFETMASQLRARGTNKEDKNNVIDTTYQPMSTQDRALQSQQVTKAITRKGRNWVDMLVQFAPAIIMIIFVVIMVLFWDRITQPTLQAQASNLEYMKELKDFQQQNLRLYMMLTGGKGNGTYIVQELPSDEQVFLRPKTEVLP